MKTNYNNNLEQLDQLARTALTDYEVPFDSMDWGRMEAELDKKYAKPTSTVWFIKGVETFLMVGTLSAMLLYTNNIASDNAVSDVTNNAVNDVTNNAVNDVANNAVSGENSVAMPQYAKNEANTVDLAQNITASAENAAVEKTANGAKSTVLGINKSNVKPVANSENVKPARGVNSANDGFLNTINNSSPNISTVNKKAAEAKIEATIETKGIETKAEGQNIRVEAAPSIIRDAAGNIIEQPQVEPLQIRSTETLETLPNLQPSLLQNQIEFPKTFEQRFFADNGEKPYELPKTAFRTLSIGIAGSGDYNSVIQNSYDGIKLTDGYGYTIGARILYRVAKRFGLETGIFGSFKQYKTAANYAAANPPSQVVEKTSLNVLQIPLNIVIDAYQNSEWRVYAKAGITYNLIANGSYIWRDASKTDFNLLTNNTSEMNGGMATRNTTNLTAYDKNNSLSLNMGMGISHRINRHIAILIEPTYQHSLKGVGAHSDLINTASLVIGATYTL